MELSKRRRNSILELLHYCNILLMINNETVEEATEFLEALKCDSSLELMNIYNRLHSIMEILPALFWEICEILKILQLSHHCLFTIGVFKSMK
jgi:hypothetical protein